MKCIKSGNDGPHRSDAPGVNDELTNRLAALHDEYAGALNAALDEGRDELVSELAEEFSVVALELMVREDRAA